MTTTGEKAREYDKKVHKTWKGKAFYRKYVQPAVLKRDGNKCVKCGSVKNLDVNHKRYGEDLSIADFETLCRGCHLKFHKEQSVNWNV